MFQELIHMFQRAGYYLSRLNEQFYFYVDVQTNISWAVILIMYLLYRLMQKYVKDKALTSDELMKFFAIYTAILLIIIASYTDLKSLLSSPDRESSFLTIVVLILGIGVAVAKLGSSTDAAKKWKLILGILYIPIILIILTNGRVLEERFDALKSLVPRSNSSFIGLPGEIQQLVVGGTVVSPQIKAVQEIINRHPAVGESAIIGRKDKDGLVKPFALVILKSEESMEDEGLKQDIIQFTREQIAESEAGELREVDVVRKERLPGGDSEYQELEKILNSHQAVDIGAVAGEQDRRSGRVRPYGYVVLKPDYANVNPAVIGEQIKDFVNSQFNKNRLTDYLYPRWVEYVTDIPKKANGDIEYGELYKLKRNWSNIFRAIKPETVQSPMDEL